MKIAEARLYAYRLPLRHPLHVAGRTIHRRDGFILRLQDRNGMTGYGDICPLPGLHRESLERALEQARRLAEEVLPGMPVTGEEWTGEDELFPSVRFALESALLDLFAVEKEQPLRRRLNPEAGDVVEVNALLDKPDMKAISRVLEDGFRCVKLKVAREAAENELEVIARLREQGGPDLRLRLDANRGWELEEAAAFLRRAAAMGVEYVEEPLRNAALLPALMQRIGVPVALDESLLEPEGSKLARLPGVAALVIKPGLLGDLRPVDRWARLARENGQKLVISSVFESGIGLLALAELAAALAGTETPAGLDTSRWLAEDLLEPRPVIHCGQLDLNRYARQNRRLKEENLRPVV